jgi:hypothetical protein
VFVFSAPENRLYRGSATTYRMWAEANNFEWTTPEYMLDYLKEKP